MCAGYIDLGAIDRRYGIDPRRYTGDEYLYMVADKLYHGQPNAAADRYIVHTTRIYNNAALMQFDYAVLLSSIASVSTV
jgi:hypothetical protein